MKDIGRCETCALRSQDGTICQVFKIQVTPKDYCFKHQMSPKKCQICQRFIVEDSIVFLQDDTPIELCGECASQLSKCPTCHEAQFCDFETNPSSLPKIVQQKIQQGPMTAVTTIRNPARVDITCRKNCKCFSNEKGCLREFGSCGNHHLSI